MNESSVLALLVSHWARETNRACRGRAFAMRQRRLHRAALLTLAVLLFLAGRVFAETDADAPTGRPDATIDLATKAGVDQVQGQWRYSDTRIIEVDFKAAGVDKQPTGAPIKTYDYEPHAGGPDFDDSKWETIEPSDARRAQVDRPDLLQLVSNQHHDSEKVAGFDLAGATAVFETALDDYAEVWVDGELSRSTRAKRRLRH